MHEENYEIIQQMLPHKEADHDAVMLPISICNIEVGNELIDLGASVNVVPLLVVKKVSDLQIEPNATTMHMADKTYLKPMGTIKDILIKFDKFLFRLYFMVLNIEADQEIPLILERVFMKTIRMLVNIYGGHVTIKIKGYEVCFKIIGIT